MLIKTLTIKDFDYFNARRNLKNLTLLEFQNQAVQTSIELYVIVLIQLQKILIRQDGNIYLKYSFLNI
jgi:hypothetical protein